MFTIHLHSLERKGLQENKQANREHTLKGMISAGCLPSVSTTMTPKLLRKQTKAKNVKVVKVLSITGSSCKVDNYGYRAKFIS